MTLRQAQGEAVAVRNRAAERCRRMRRANSALVHMAVRFLRASGHRVGVAQRRRGEETHHELDGQIVPTSWLLDMARAEGWAPQFVTSADANVRPRR